MPDYNGAMLENTIQSDTHREDITGLDILPFFLRAGELLPPYWSRARDMELSRFWMKIDHVSSSFYMFSSKFASIPLRILPRDQGIKTHVKGADDLTAILNSLSDFGMGWASSFAVRWVLDYVTQDNGAFAEVIGDAPRVFDPRTGRSYRDTSKPRVGFYGLAILDSQHCQRTTSPEYPVLYTDTDGNRYKLHRTRVIFASSMPSNRRRLNRVGFSALSRMINSAQHLYDISTMEQEELGSRPKRRLIIGKRGITAGEIRSAFTEADTQMDNSGLQRYAKNVVVAPTNKATSANEVEIEILDLHKALDGMDKEKSITLGMFLIALALGIPPRWLWPATSTGATKADAMYQHLAGAGGGLGHLITLMISLLGGDDLSGVLGKPIGPEYQIVFDEQDDDQDARSADIRKQRALTWKTNLETAVIDKRVARLQALEAGDISEQQFEDMELAEGRLVDGQDILNLFYSTDEMLAPMLQMSVGDILNTEANDRETVLAAIADKELEVRATLANPTRPKEFDTAKVAFAALLALKRLYSQPMIQQEGLQDIGQSSDSETTPETGDKKVSTNGERRDDNSDSREDEDGQRKPIPANGNLKPAAL